MRLLVVLIGQRVNKVVNNLKVMAQAVVVCGLVLLVSLRRLRRRGREARRALFRIRLPRLLGLQLRINLRRLLSCIWLPLLLRLPMLRCLLRRVWLPLLLRLRRWLRLRLRLRRLLRVIWLPLLLR